MSATAGLGAHRLSLAVALSLFISLFAVSAASAARPDFDGDGATATDCAPLDPAVRPGKVDKPDLAFEDTNCDGIDGDKAKAIFVNSGAANNNGTGSLTSPKATLNGAQGAIATAKAANKDVYLAGGTYNETALLEDNVGLFGGYEPITGERNGALTTIKGSPAVLAEGDQGVVLQLLTLEGTQDGSGNAYGIRAIKDGADPSQLVLSNVKTTAVPAASPTNGVFQGNGFFGSGSGGGSGGLRSCNAGIGAPGSSGFGLGGLGGGLGGIFGDGGAPGGTGSTGGNGGNTSFVTTDDSTWQRPFAGIGGNGGSGGGGGGGRGGTGVSIFLFGDGCGGNGGAGGDGGGGGFAGTGGRSGAGSFGAYLLDSSVTALGGSKFTSGAGGAGGNGANGGGGGGGTGPGATTIGITCVLGTICGLPGFSGGSGGQGGSAGGGGGGAGGPSAGVYQAGAGSGYTAKSGTTQQAAAAGQGGLRGNGGTRAANGQSAPVMRSGTAPTTSTSDFDGDGINDSADACPDQARGASGSANGCPARAAKLADSDGDGVPNTRDGCPSVAASEANDPDNDGCPPVVQPPAVQPPVITPPGGGGMTVLPSTTSINSLAFGKFTKLTNLSVKNLVAGTTVTVTCKTKSKKQQKKGCPYKSKRFTTSGARAQLNLRKPFAKKRVPVGTRITITIVAPGSIGKQIAYTIRKRKLPKSRVLCVPPGGKPGNCA